MKQKTNFFKQNTRIKNFIPLPRFILAEDISSSAKMIYGLLVARTMVSQKEENADKWSDTVGNIYIMYTIQNLAKDSGLSTGAVKKALEQLREAELIQTIKNGNNKPNTIFVKYHKGAFDETEVKETDGYTITIIPSDDDRQMAVNCQSNDRHQNVSLREDTYYPSGSTDNDLPESHNLTPIYTDNINQNNHTDVSESESTHYDPAGIARIREIVKRTTASLPYGDDHKA